MYSIIFSTLLLLFSSFALANERIDKEMTYSVGLVNTSYAESETGLTGENVQEAASGSVSSISGQIQYKFAPGFDKSYFLTGTFPLLPGATGSYFGGHVGVEFYFGEKIGSKVSLNNSGTTIKVKPRNVFFWGLEGGLGYLVYVTETAKKTDLLLDIGGFVGGTYIMSDKWRIRGQLGVTRGTGVNTTTMEMKAFFGLSYYITE